MKLIYKIINYNLKIIFAGRFVWFLLAALAIFVFFMLQSVWEQSEPDNEFIYDILILPGLLLVFYPAVFGIQNDADSRILEILFGIPDYRYKVWGVRLLIIFLGIYLILTVFSYLSVILLYPVNPFAMAAQLMFPVFFFGTLAFMFSTITRSGNGTAVIVIIMSVVFLMLSSSLWRTFWNVFLNPYDLPNNIHISIWQSTIIKNRIFMSVAGILFTMVGLLNLQRREKFI